MSPAPTPPPPATAPEPAPDDFRVGDAVEVAALLEELIRQRVLLTVSSPCGASYTTLPWELDAARGLLRFSADDRNDHALSRVLEAGEAVAVGYLERIKVQFEVQGLVLVHAGAERTLNCALPAELFRFQRRNSFRVRPLGGTQPTARFQHPQRPQARLELRVLDVSVGGVALFLPDPLPGGLPAVAAGSRLDRVRLDLGEDTQLECGLRVHHVTGMNPESRGVRLGCEIEGIDGRAQLVLQRFIDLTQRRRRLMARGPD